MVDLLLPEHEVMSVVKTYEMGSKIGGKDSEGERWVAMVAESSK